MKKAGKILLLIGGIALIAIGVWSLIGAIIGLLGVIGGASAGGEEGAALLIAGIVAMVISGLLFVFYLLSGLAGIKVFTKGEPKYINRAFIWAIVILVLNVLGLIFGGFSLSTIFGLVVDVIYIVGAFMAKLAK